MAKAPEQPITIDVPDWQIEAIELQRQQNAHHTESVSTERYILLLLSEALYYRHQDARAVINTMSEKQSKTAADHVNTVLRRTRGKTT